LETQVTDANGKYGFFVRRSVYYMTVEREGYEAYKSADIDLTTTEAAVIDHNIALKLQRDLSTPSSQGEELNK
jgi:hypothetical protein